MDGGDTGCSQHDPDIAGIGVVLSFVLAALLTTACAVSAAFIDAAVLDEASIFPPVLENYLNDRTRRSLLPRLIRWRNVLERLILSMADQQLVTGYGLMIVGAIYGQEKSSNGSLMLYDPHYTLIVWLACLASSSHLASTITLRKYMMMHPRLAYVRIAFTVIFAVGLLLSFILSNAWTGLSATLVAVFFREFSIPLFSMRVSSALDILIEVTLIYTFYLAVVQLYDPTGVRMAGSMHACARRLRFDKIAAKFHPSSSRNTETASGLPGVVVALGKIVAKVFWIIVLGSPLGVLVMQLLFTGVSLSVVAYIKYLPESNGCGLNDAAENTWGFGQILPMLLLVLPLLSIFEFYHGMLQAFLCLDNATVHRESALLTASPERRRAESSDYWTYRIESQLHTTLPLPRGSSNTDRTRNVSHEEETIGTLPRAGQPRDEKVDETDTGQVALAGPCRPATR